MSRREVLKRRIEAAERELAKLDALPDFAAQADGTVMALAVTHGPSHPYTYIAFRTAGRWFLTGAKGPNGVSSAELEDWLTTQGRRLRAFEFVAEIELVKDLGEVLMASLRDRSADALDGHTGRPY